ncbi:MAG: DUF5723 family protein [Leeuwenhoekiella sp.]
MKRALKISVLLIAFTFYLNATAQSFVGHNLDNYSGIHGVVFNPANVVGSNFKTDINLVSFSTLLGSDYVGISLSEGLSDLEESDFDNYGEIFPKENNQFFNNLNVLGPSFMFNLSPKSSIALTTRARFFTNLNNLNGKLFETLIEDFDETEDFPFDVRNFSGTVHSWAEVGLTYGRILLQSEKNLLKAGLTVRYLQGAGAIYMSAPVLSGNYDATQEILTTTGSLEYGSTQGFEEDSFEFNSGNSGFGADIGFSYEFTSANKLEAAKRVHNNYTLKLAASITDIGSLSYNDVRVKSYDMDASVDENIFRDSEDFEETLDEAYIGQESFQTLEVNLPTALHLVADYSLTRRLFISAKGTFSLVDAAEPLANRVLNTFVLAPRMETKWFSLYSPLSFRQYDGLAWGAGLRLGPFHVGSGSVLTNLLSESSKTVDVFAGVKIPIYRK